MAQTSRSESTYWLIKPKRWFLFSVAGLMGVLLGAILLATLILLRTGREPRQAVIIGNSMEPTLIGPAKTWTCENCFTQYRFAQESINPNQPLICPFCQAVSGTPTYELFTDGKNASIPLETVQYHVRSFVASRRKSAGERTVFQGLKRGDLVVFNATDLDRREIKRVVGFPGETIEIKRGDLLVNGQRWRKDVQTLLNQAVLIASSEQFSSSDLRWDGGYKTPAHSIVLKPKTDADSSNATSTESVNQLTLLRTNAQEIVPISAIERAVKPPHWIDNRVISNLHDSHQLIPIRDIGLALQFASVTPQWTLTFEFDSFPVPISINLSCNTNNSWDATFNEVQKQTTAPKIEPSKFAAWLVVTIVDGDLVISRNSTELFRWNLPDFADAEEAEVQSTDTLNHTEKLPSTHRHDETNRGSEHGRSPFILQVRCMAGEVEIAERLVFRDIEYRGAGDADQQVFEEKGMVLLGDNVSLSFDSRERWPDGISASAITGVIDLPQSGIEHLLRQRELLPKKLQ